MLFSDIQLEFGTKKEGKRAEGEGHGLPEAVKEEKECEMIDMYSSAQPMAGNCRTPTCIPLLPQPNQTTSQMLFQELLVGGDGDTDDYQQIEQPMYRISEERQCTKYRIL